MSTTDFGSMSTTTEKAVYKPAKRRSWFWNLTIAFSILLLLGILTITGLVIAQRWTAPVVNNAETAALDISEGESEGQKENAESPKLKGSITDKLITLPKKESDHVLDPTLIVAREGLQHIQSTVKDYTATLVKQERVNGKLLQTEFATCKIRRAQTVNGEEIPFAVYLKFLKPASVAGREVIYIDGFNKDRLIAHEGGSLNVMTAHLKPDSMMAMRGNRYPITEIGIETLVKRMIEKGERDRDHEDCTIDINRDVEVDGVSCTLITITHEKEQDPFDFHIAKIYINDENNLPLGYRGYDWPKEEGGAPRLIESYFYRNIKVNVGLTDEDFNPKNSDYNYPRFGL